MLLPRIVSVVLIGVWVTLVTEESFAVLSSDSDAVPIQYRISFRQAETHRVDIEATFPVEGAEQLELMMPVWTPGSYLIREYARQVETIEARNIGNEPIEIQKKSKNRWTVSTKGLTDVTVRYTLYCREMGVRSNWVEKDFAFLTGAATFITRTDTLERKHLVRLDALPSWPRIATSLAKVDNDEWLRVASNFDELVDGPILIGDIDIQSFEAGGAKHHLATIGTDGLWNTKKAAEDVQKIVEAEQAFWKEVPYQEYWFLNLATETGGGLEHDNSTVLMTSRWTMRQRPKYLDWLGLVSHEFFHTWNVRRLRPKVLTTYDYENEQYTRELWVAEGVTSYYDDLMLVRSGLGTPKEYLARISKTISGVQNSAGRHVQSLAESSFDTWVKFYRPDENAPNSRISYYTKGSLIALLLDTEIRIATNGERSLDDVMRHLWKEHRESGYTTDDVIRITNEIAGTDLGNWFQQGIDSTNELDYSKLLDWYGLEWKPKEAPKSEETGEEEKRSSPYLGVEVSNQQGKATIDKVLSGSPGAESGLNVGDEIIALENYRVASEGWKERLDMYHAGDAVEFLIARRGKLQTIKVKLGETPEKTWTLQRVKEPTDEQEARWKSWLGL